MHKELIFEITCIIPSLLIAIEKSIVNFFNSTNFGTRNSKGFGGFEVVAKNGVALKRDVTNQPEFWRNIPDLLAVYQCELDFENPNEIFKSINEQYQVLKSGLNPPGRYIKSILFQYFASKRIKWEKRWIKHALNQAGIMNIIEQGELPLNADCHNNWDQEVHEQFEYKYIRALFGLAEHNDYKKRIPGKPFKIKIKNGIHGNGIERSKSPLTIKVIQNKIFILVFPVSPLMLNQPFTFSFDTNNHQTQSQNIHTPDEFDIVEFMDFATNLINKVSLNQDPRPPECKDDLDKLKLKYKRLI
ncbi:MAG: hypothetical protein IPP06_09600 [Saprospiraceae bacterium]|nr:hypothetical protein [Candidatus Vicinibacter affinis]